MSKSKQLERSVRRYQRRVSSVEKVIYRLSVGRLVVFLLLMVCVSLSFGGKYSGTAAWLCLALLALFLFLMRRHDRLFRLSTRLATALALQQEDLHRVQRDFSKLPTRDYGFDKDHPFAADLDLDGPFSLLKLLDNSFHQAAGDRLKSWLERIGSPAEIRLRQEAVAELAGKRRIRLRALVTARCRSRTGLKPEDARDWLTIAAPWSSSRGLYLLARGLSLATTAAFLLSFLTPLQLPWMPLLLVSLLFAQVMQHAHGHFLRQFHALGPAFSASAAISSEIRQLRPRSSYLKQRFEALGTRSRESERSFHSLVQLHERLEYRSNGFALLLLNGFFLADQHYVRRIQKWRERHGADLAERIALVLEFEALASLGNYAWLFPDPFPELVEGRAVQLEAKGLAHPCLPPDRRVGNDYALVGLGQMHLITGSNMSGKSTFLRTVALNLLLARMGAPVCAREMRCNLPRVWTSIRIEDSLESGVSFFYAEVKRLKRILDDLATAGEPVIYLLDEILRGTNSRERLIACKALVRYLIEQEASGLMTTHDLELLSLANGQPKIENFHFQEAVEGERLYFDYRLKPGELTSTNAIRLLKSEKLPLKFEE